MLFDCLIQILKLIMACAQKDTFKDYGKMCVKFLCRKDSNLF